jgi:hypothetical protein
MVLAGGISQYPDTDEIASFSAASAPQVIRSARWRPTKDSDEVIAVGNTSLAAKQVQIRFSDAYGALTTSRQLQLPSHQNDQPGSS